MDATVDEPGCVPANGAATTVRAPRRQRPGIETMLTGHADGNNVGRTRGHHPGSNRSGLSAPCMCSAPVQYREKMGECAQTHATEGEVLLQSDTRQSLARTVAAGVY